ncbi:MAG: ABC transporter permease [Polyangiaceae bacterium]
MQLVWNAIRLALSAIVRNKTRATLTVLGILIGVAAVVTVTALSEAATEKVSGEIEQLGSNVLFVFPQSTQSSGAKSKTTGRLTENDARAIVRESISVSGSAPYLEVFGQQIVYGEKNVATQVIGTTLSYFPLRSFKLARGEFWSDADELVKTKTCVLGTTVAENLFGADDPVGRVVRIGRSPYRVVGVLARRGASPFGEDEDDRVMMPIGSFRARVMHTSPGRADLLIAGATSEKTTDRAIAQIKEILRQRHRIPEGRENDFQVESQAEFREKQEAITGALSALLLGVAGVSLLVGGIGVMNIMLVSVAERTREIGIRMSIGARQGDILTQFLIEAIVLSMLGGALGIQVGVGLTFGLGRALDWPMFPSATSISVAVFTSAFIGVVFGFLPARRASSLDPIDALRTD